MSKSNGTQVVFDRTVLTEEFTPTQSRLLDHLQNGAAHLARDLVKCLWDDMGAPANVKVHVCVLRRKLRPHGWDILVERYPSGACYRLVRYITSAI